MNNINFGIAKSVVAHITTQSMLDNKLNQSSGVAKDFLRIIENSQVLQNEFDVYGNIEGKNIESEVLAARYVENNIKLMHKFTTNEINEAHNHLVKFIEKNILFEDVNISNEKMVLYNSINNLIVNDDTKINENHIATENIVNYLKYSKENEMTTDITDEPFALLEQNIYLGVIVSVQAALGCITPPFGSNIFVAAVAFDRPYLKIIKGIPVYLLIFILVTILLISVPELSTLHRYFK